MDKTLSVAVTLSDGNFNHFSVDIDQGERFLKSGQYPTLTVMSAGHSLHIFVNGQPAGRLMKRLWSSDGQCLSRKIDEFDFRFLRHCLWEHREPEVDFQQRRETVGRQQQDLDPERRRRSAGQSFRRPLHARKLRNPWNLTPSSAFRLPLPLVQNGGEHFETWNVGVLGPVVLNGLNEGRRDLSWQKWTYSVSPLRHDLIFYAIFLFFFFRMI